MHGPILQTCSNQRSMSCRAVNIQPHKAPRSSLYSPPRSSLCSSAAPTSRDFEFIFRTFACRSTYFLRRHHHINLLGNQSRMCCRARACVQCLRAWLSASLLCENDEEGASKASPRRGTRRCHSRMSACFGYLRGWNGDVAEESTCFCVRRF